MSKKFILLTVLVAVSLVFKLHHDFGKSPVPECYAKLEFTAPTPERPFLMSFNEERAYHKLYGRSFLELLWDGEYDILDSSINRFRNKQERGIGGDWKLNTVYRRITCFKHSQKNLDKFKQKITSWTHERPNSFNAKLMMAVYWYTAAWESRGGGYTSTVSEEGWNQMTACLHKSQAILQDISKQGENCPYYHELLIWVNLDLNDMESTMKLWQEAVELFPNYHYFHKHIAFRLLPRWCGSNEEVVHFANKTCDIIGGDQGHIAYIYIVKTIYRSCENNGFFERFNFDWDKIKKGYEARERLYGRSHKVSIVFLDMANSKGDTEVVDHLLTLFNDNWTENDWKQEKKALKIRNEHLNR